MTFDFSQLQPQPRVERPIDPIALFQRSRVTDSSINDLWLAQGDALRQWHEKRDERDIAVSLNTGAGKTLVGLLMAQSLVNETRGSVLYACSSIQLVRQTEKKAAGYGLPTTTYVEREYSNDLFAKSEAACLTTYQALFNGRSIFANRDISAIVFDDAHAAEHLLRDHFSLNLSKEDFGSEYAAIVAEFSDYFHAVGLASSYSEVRDGIPGRLLLVPPTEARRSHAAIRQILTESKVPGDAETKWAWGHLKDKIDLCAIVLGSSAITFTPPFVPIRTLRYFSSDVRRIYLSATLSAADVFVRTFGRKPSVEIKPTTTAGECERMIIVPSKFADGNGDDVEIAKSAIRKYKTLVLVPSYARATEWSPLKPPPRDQATEAIEDFKTATGSKKLLLAARYDGMDLPGDMCRVIVIDDLPSGLNALDRFLWEYLRLSNRLLTAIATRVIQSFGRISRGMSDHGVVLLTGTRLVEWLQVPRNVAALPRFLQKQLQLGFQMSGTAAAGNAASMIESCLNRNAEWVGAYERFIREAPVEPDAPTPPNLAAIALAEAKYAEHMWNRDYEGAARRLRETLDLAASISLGTVSWHNLWLGFAIECAGDAEGGRRLHRQAHTGQRNIPPPRPNDQTVLSERSPQVVEVSYQFELAPNARIQAPRTLERDLLPLSGGATSGQTEEAIRCLGQYLGFQSTRPDKEHGTGPDVLWIFPDSSTLCIDVKTNKEDSSVYRKDELGQLSDHVQWVRDNAHSTDITPIFIGPEVGVSDVANPPAGVKVASLQKFRAVADTLLVAYSDITTSALSTTLMEVINEELAKRELLWPVLLRNLELVELRGLASR
jgi:hypothetical protein